ncbi:hypothetical protein C0J52_02840 [Blattella germanica]|nr:hypothetical protein C0J52_02840 [Blattella germanica]
MPGKPVKRKTRLERRLILLSSVIAIICIALIITLARPILGHKYVKQTSVFDLVSISIGTRTITIYHQYR